LACGTTLERTMGEQAKYVPGDSSPGEGDR
jgi:hypothetical protein